MVYGKESSGFYNHSARMIQLMLCGTQYVTQVSLNYILHILKLVYIHSPNRRLVYIYVFNQKHLRFKQRAAKN